MGAARTGLRKYLGPQGPVYAARIAAVTPFVLMKGALTLHFESGKRVNLVPDWVAANKPASGGYFVAEDVKDDTVCRYVDAEAFASQYKVAA